MVGHDWGAALAWALAAVIPDRVEKLVAISVGHPSAFRNSLSVEQLQRSWYMWFFQFREVAEELLTRDDLRIFKEWAGHPARRRALSRRPLEAGKAHGCLQLVPSQHRPPETGVPADPTPADQSLDTGSLRERRVKGYIVMEEEASAGRRPDGLRRDRLAVAEYGCFSAIARDRDTTSWEARCQSHLK